MRALFASLLILGMTALPAALIADHREWLTSVETALAQARQNDQRILVDLYADWCGWCKRLEEDVFSTQTFQEFAEDFVLLRVDTEDGAEGSRLQQRFDAYSLPTTLVLDHRQALIAEVMGYAPAPQYVANIQQEIASFEELIRGYERFGEADDLRVLSLLADEFHQRNDGDRAATLYRRMMATDPLTPDKEVRIRYQLIDALRLAARYDEALEELDRARGMAAQMEEDPIFERFDLLAAQVSLDRGDCDKAQLALENFLGTHPTSDLFKVAERTLQTLKAKGFQCI